VELVESQAALAEADRKRETSLADLKTEHEVLNAQLESERKAAHERDVDLEEEIKIHKDRLAKELARVVAQNERDLKAKDAVMKTQEESYKYKLQYLELSQKDLKRERKLFQDKEQATKKQVAQLSSEVREVKSQLRQQVDIHEAYRQHVESKEAARSTEVSGWDIRKQALLSEHSLETKRNESKNLNRIAQLEAELERLKADYENQKMTIQQLNEQIAEGGGSYEPEPVVKKRESKRYDEPVRKQAEPERQPERQPEPSGISITASLDSGVSVEASFGDESERVDL